MERQSESSLLQAIKKDDIKAFNALMEKAQCGAYRLGRFPVLSLLYLYKSRKILKEYEEKFLAISSYEELGEPIEVSKKFSGKARKCLRLYLDEVISPLEMLLILDRTQHLKKVFPMTKPSSQIKGRLKAIYSIKYALGVRYAGDSISLDRRPLSRREKKKLATACISAVLIVAIAIGVPVTAVSLMPKHVDGEVSTVSDIRFDSSKEYTLINDVVVTDGFTAKNMNCSIKGNGKKLILKKGVSLGELNGKISDLTVETAGDPIFTALTVNASLENVTVNVNADVETREQSAFVALTNYGKIDGVTVNISGKVNALDPETELPEGSSNEFAFGGIVQYNSYLFYNILQQYKRGIIVNCAVNYSQFTLTGTSKANATFGGIAGVNDGYLQNCTVSGEITADTFDIAGICAENNFALVNDINNAKLAQTSASDRWNPNSAGIVLNNGYAVEDCINNGEISAVSTSEPEGEDISLAAISAGIACINSNRISNSTNNGAITATARGTAYAGGIASRSVGMISKCLSDGEIAASGQKVYAGGILGNSEVTASGGLVYFGRVENCISKDKFSVTASDGGNAFVGGIAGYIQESGFKQTYVDKDGNRVEETVYFGGGVVGSYFIGEYTSGATYFGAIVGACGVNIFTSNSYSATSGATYKNFDGNFYLNGFKNAIGATITVTVDEETQKEKDEFAPAADKGATSASLEYITEIDRYKAILKAIENG